MPGFLVPLGLILVGVGYVESYSRRSGGQPTPFLSLAKTTLLLLGFAACLALGAVLIGFGWIRPV
jgi:hypothetical protein